MAAECGSPEAVRAAEAALLPIFSPEWAAELVASERDTHPFEWAWVDRGGIAKLVKLGFSLHRVGSPQQLTADLREPARFATRSSEAWAGAFMIAHGATVEYIDERSGGDEQSVSAARAKPEFIARIDETRVAVEVKHLDMGDDERAYMQISNAFSDGFFFGECEAGAADLPNAGTRAIYRQPPHLLEVLANQGLEAACAAADRCGRKLGNAYAAFVRDGPADGRYPVAPGLDVLVGTEYSGSEGTSPFPPLESYITRLRRNKLIASAKKFCAYCLPGIVVLFRPSWPVWPHELIEAAAKVLSTSKPLASVAAVIFVDEPPMPGLRWLVDRVHVVPGPAWLELPDALRSRFSRCGECNAMHLPFELLGR